jgi:hypothetical protein
VAPVNSVPEGFPLQNMNTRTTVFLAALLGATSTLPAQPAGRGGQAGTPLSVTQQLTLTREMEVPAALTSAQAAAAAALARASLTVPANPADLTARANDLAAAELALASARAEGFERAQKALQPLTAEQAAAYARGGAGGGRGGAAANWQSAYYDQTGFVSLFDGKTLTGWEAEEGKWDVQNGTIHRHQTLEPKNFVDFGQYHIHYKEVFADFHLKVEVKLTSGNAGIQYRSRLETALRAQPGEPARVEAPGAAGAAGARGGAGTVAIPLRNVAAAIADPLGKPLPANIKTLDDALKAGLLPEGVPYGNGTGHPWQVSGYQFDFLPTPTGNTGSFYEGQGRGVAAQTGEILLMTADANGNSVRTVLGKVADLPVQQFFKPGDWNQVEIIARGNTLIHMLNGRVFTVVIDDDASRRAMKGIISLQLEGPADNEVWYRNIWIKKL